MAMAVSLIAKMISELDGAGNVVRALSVDEPNEASGDLYFIKKTGERMEANYQHLMVTLGWNGDAAQLLIKPGEPGALPIPPPFKIVVKRDDYKNETRYRIDQIGVRQRGLPVVAEHLIQTAAERMNAKIKGTWKPPAPEPGSSPPDEIPF
jgi:hypothetical protein